MAFTTIPRFKYGNCDCGCGGINVEGRKVGKMFYCLRSYSTMKQKQQLAKSIEKQKVRSLIKTDANQNLKQETDLEKWFKERRKGMTGKCSNCGEPSCKSADNYKNSIAHILPKAYFPSVATHKDNWIELCFWNNSCHTQMDNKMLDLIDMNCFSEIVDKFVKMYPSIATIEKRRIPSVLMQYIEVEK